MSHFLIADGHYRGTKDEPVRLERLLTTAREHGMRELTILGDLFEVWLGLRGLEKQWHEPLFALFFALRREGIILRYVVGNRDYFVEDWNDRHRLFNQVADRELRLDSPAGPLVLAHGDLVNRADRQYRQWRALSRSAPLALIARALPRPTLDAIAGHVAEKLRSTNRAHKSRFPEAELRARARELKAGEATLVFGHFHEQHDFQEGDKRIITLPFLGDENSGVLASKGGFELITA